MHVVNRKPLPLSITMLLGGALLAASSAALAAHPNFEEADVDVAYSLFSEQPGDSFGWVADPIGDINNDGATDFVTSAPFQVNNGNVTGKGYVYSGSDGSLLNSVEGNAGEFMGYSATLAGDVNNDGVNDYVFGSRARVQVYSGADHSLIHEWAIAGEGFGFDTSTAGDLDGDNHDDIIVGAPFSAVNGPLSGSLYAYSGKTGGLLWQFDGQAGWLNGLGVGLVGDINGDDVPDVVTAAHGAAKNFKGRAFVLSGVDGSVLLALDPKGPSPSSTMPTTFGRFHIHGAGDVDGDGLPDIFAGDFNAKGGQHRRLGFGKGAAFIFSGADGSIIDKIEAETFGDGMGPGRGVADIDNDGLADIFVAAYAFGTGVNDINVGKGYLISGGTGEIIRTMTGKTPGEFIGVDATPTGDVNQDGLTDYLLTGFGSLYVIYGN